MNENPGLLLSIIVPVYNVENYIRPCMESIFRQDLDENTFEVIIVNDGTEDRSMEVIQDIIEQHKNITVLNQENQGLSVARNNGIAKAKGEYVLMPDSDDLLIENSLKPLLEKAIETRVDLVVADFIALKDQEIKEMHLHIPKQPTPVYIEKTGERLIVDNTQAFYAKPMAGIDTFYTCRKFFGVPDGAYLYTEKMLDEELEQDISYDRMTFLNKRIDLGAEAAYGDFQTLSKSLVGQPIKLMSNLTQRLMLGIDYEKVAQQRRDNYLQLHAALSKSNTLSLPLEDDAVPMVYPYLAPVKGLRERLIENKVFVARYWPNVLDWTTKEDIEYLLAYQMLPLPVDQRYGEEYMQRMIELMK